MMYMVTVKLAKNPQHNPHAKMTGPCPANLSATCTDVTGEHHTILVRNWEGSLSELIASYQRLGQHVTRVETVE